MKKISQIVSGVSEEVKAQFKEKRINKALEISMLNAQEDLETAKMHLEEFASQAAHMEAEDIIQSLVDLLMEKKHAEEILAIHEEVRAYLNEEV